MRSDKRNVQLSFISLLKNLKNSDDTVFTVVDAANNFELFLKLKESGNSKTYSLFRGDLAPQLDHVAPHLVLVDLESEFTALWVEHFGENMGVLFLTKEKPEDVCNHLRSILIVKDENDEEYLFRYFDPRVLRLFLPTCTWEEAREFFGPIKKIIFESEESNILLVCEPASFGVRIERTHTNTVKSKAVERY
jgi:hypothetical protein